MSIIPAALSVLIFADAICVYGFNPRQQGKDWGILLVALLALNSAAYWWTK